jgi:hypothetical protein
MSFPVSKCTFFFLFKKERKMGKKKEEETIYIGRSVKGKILGEVEIFKRMFPEQKRKEDPLKFLVQNLGNSGRKREMREFEPYYPPTLCD